MLSYPSWDILILKGKVGPGGLYLGIGRKRGVMTKPNEIAGRADACWGYAFPIPQ